MIANGFLRRCVSGVPFFSCIALEKLAGLRHGFSTREGGADSPQGNSLNLSLVPWDTPQRVAENRRRLLEALGLAHARLVTLSQVHSDVVHIIVESDGQRNRRREGDALVTQQAGVALGVLLADCFPILLADPESGAVAAVHSGWRGAGQRILSKTIQAMCKSFGSDPGRLTAAIGPGIRGCCFEVGLEVMDLFGERYPGEKLGNPLDGRPGKFFLDLPRALEIQLQDSGVGKHRIFDIGLCTRCSPGEFFSYRAEGQRSGRMMAVISRIH